MFNGLLQGYRLSWTRAWMAGAAVIVAVCGACSAPHSQAADAARRPNIVFIFSDDHAYQAISAYGDPRRLIETPNIDRLAREGMRFDRCLVPNSICGPSRATVLTGKYSHANGFYNNTNSRFDGSQTTFPKLLQAAGYQTAIFGKWHLVTDPTGFDDWQILPGQGVYYNPPMIAGGRTVQHQGYVTDIITELSLDWLRKRDRSRPFLLMCQHKAPHRGWEPALRHLKHDLDRSYPEPATLFDDYSGRGKAEHSQDMTIARTLDEKDLKLVPPPELTPDQRRVWDAYYVPRNAALRAANLQGKDLVRWKYNRYLHDYLGCIRAVDESVGRVLSFLDKEGLADETIVVYASDQGFYLGEHGWFDKRWIFEESLRAPLLVRWPGTVKPGSHSARIVSNLDFAETFLDAAGMAIPLRDAGTEPRAVAQGTGTRRLANELLLPLLRISRAPQCPPPLWCGDRSLQARPLLRTRGGRVGVIRSSDRPARATECLRSSGSRDRPAGTQRRAPAAPAQPAGSRSGPAGDHHQGAVTPQVP